MRRFIPIFVLLLMLLTIQPSAADPALTQLVNVTWVSRSESPALHDIAHQRAVEISSCPIESCFNHSGMRSGTGEVLAWNSGFADPLSNAIHQWLTSPVHHAILSNPEFTEIGCATQIVAEKSYFVCVVAFGDSSPLPPQPQPGEPLSVPNPESDDEEPVLLPNTALDS